jgi:hypothetical protein
MCSRKDGGVVVAGSVKTWFGGGVHDGLGDGDILCLLQFVAVLAPPVFPPRSGPRLFLRGASTKAKCVLPLVLFFLDGQRRLLGVVSGAMAPDTYSSAKQSSGGSGVAWHGSGSSGSHSISARVLRFLGSLSSSGGWIWGENPTAAADTGRRAQPGLYRGGTRVWARGRTAGGASERRGEHPRLPAKKGGGHGRRRARASLYACVSGEGKGE